MSGVGNISGQVAALASNGAVGMNVLKKSMNMESEQATQLLQTLTPANPNVGSKIDVRA